MLTSANVKFPLPVSVIGGAARLTAVTSITPVSPLSLSTLFPSATWPAWSSSVVKWSALAVSGDGSVLVVVDVLEVVVLVVVVVVPHTLGRLAPQTFPAGHVPQLSMARSKQVPLTILPHSA